MYGYCKAREGRERLAERVVPPEQSLRKMQHIGAPRWRPATVLLPSL